MTNNENMFFLFRISVNLKFGFLQYVNRHDILLNSNMSTVTQTNSAQNSTQANFDLMNHNYALLLHCFAGKILLDFDVILIVNQ